MVRRVQHPAVRARRRVEQRGPADTHPARVHRRLPCQPRHAESSAHLPRGVERSFGRSSRSAVSRRTTPQNSVSAAGVGSASATSSACGSDARTTITPRGHAGGNT
jgi:hypothetical protein